MKLGLSLGYSGAELAVPVELVQRAEALGYDFGVDGGSLRLGRRHPARLPGRQDAAHQARHRHHAARRTHARQCRHVGCHRRCARGRGPVHRRHRRVRAADRRRLVRPALGQALLAHQGLRGDHAQDLRARGPSRARGPRDQPALYGARRDGRRQAAEVDPAHAPRHPHLSGHRQRGDGEAHRRDRRRLAAARLRARLDARVPSLARGGLPAQRRPRSLPTSRSRAPCTSRSATT